MGKRLLLLWTFLSVGFQLLVAQSLNVSGVVISKEDDLPVAGAAVLVKGSSKGTITDIDGNFSIANVPQNATLVVSFIGQKTTEVAAAANLRILLDSDTQLLNEVVITALGIQRQAKEVGYATAKITADELNVSKGTNATSALIGKVSGLQVTTQSANLDGDVRVNLRGSRSFKGDNSALLVLDGVQTPLSYLQSLNPNDIENVSVLKGAGAAALYGSDAANGVLYVSTKQGNRGKPNLTYSLTTTFDKVAYLPKLQSRFGPGQTSGVTGLPDYIADENQQYGTEFDGSLINVGSPLFDPENPSGTYLQLPYSFVKNGREGFYQTGVGIQNDVSYSSSDERGSMYLSYQHLDKTGTIEKDKQIRQTLRFNASRNYKKLTVAAKTSYSNTANDLNNISSGGIYNLMNTAGHINIRDYRNWSDPNVRGASPDEWLNDYYTNPWFQLDNYRKANRQDRLTLSADVDYQAFPWLKLQARGGISLGFTNSTTTQGAYHFTDWAKKNVYGARNDIYSLVSTNSSLSSRTNLDFIASADHAFGDFKLKGLLGYSIQDVYAEDKEVKADRLEIDNFFNVKNKIGELGGSNSWSRSRKLGFFGSIDLGYRDWAFLQVTGRNDWTSLLDPSRWSFFYPSANVSVVLSEVIPSLKESDTVSHLKLRSSAAKVGTVNIANYNLDDLVNTASYFPFGTLAAYSLSTNIRNRNIEPEFTTEYEVGAELGLLRDRITLEAAVYSQTTTGQTVNISLPVSTGYTSSYTNAGTMRGRGLEFDLHLNPLVKTGDFRFNLGVNLTFIDTKVVELTGGVNELVIDSDYADYAIVGMSYPMIKATDWKRNPDGKVIVDAVTGLPSAGDIVPIGKADPAIRLGITPTFRYKDFSLSGVFDYRGGHYTRSGLEYDMLFTGSSYLSTISGRQRFVFPNSVIAQTDAAGNTTYRDNTDITVNTGGVQFWNGIYKTGRANQVFSAASWRLRELSLAYDVPQRIVNKTKVLQRVSARLVAQNLFMWVPKTNYWGDPDYSGGGNNIAGMAGTSPAGARTFGFNVLVSF
ncbi:Outer membrane receptor for ferrienterochelin and colicins [Bacteroidales bacterium Barb4]|nr:Outer membrane receptor for ferrienterochelin and colicins [Bacteroidales bacterium Barb4]